MMYQFYVSFILCRSLRLLCTLRCSISSPLKLVICFERPLTRVSCIFLDIFLCNTMNHRPVIRTSRKRVLQRFPFQFNSQKKLFQQESSHDSVAQQFLKTGQSVTKVIRFWQPWKFVQWKGLLCSPPPLWKQKNDETCSMLASFENAASVFVVQAAWVTPLRLHVLTSSLNTATSRFPQIALFGAIP